MVKYTLALTILLSLEATTHGFTGPRLLTCTRQLGVRRQEKVNDLKRNISASTLYDDDPSSSISSKVSSSIDSLSKLAGDTLEEQFPDDEDVYEAEVALKKKIINERTGTYEVNVPLTISTGTIYGLSLCEVNEKEFSSVDLNLDTLRLSIPTEVDIEETVVMNQAMVLKNLAPSFRGVIVSSVEKNGWAWKQGIRPGDILTATSATIGDNLWPKSTIEGIRSAIASRKLVSGSMMFQFQRINSKEVIGEQFELTLTKPLGFEVGETDDGYIEVSGFRDNAPKLVRYAIQKGDRILAVSNMGGTWPVSTIDGVVSAITTQLPGQQITIRFARPPSATASASASSVILDKEAPTESSNGAITTNGGDAIVEDATTRTQITTSKSATITSTRAKEAPRVNEAELLSNCRDVLRRYMSEARRVNIAGKLDVPAVVADRVVEAIATKSARFDAKTLALVMNAYLFCRQPKGAIRVFEAATGLKADGSSGTAAAIIEGKTEGSRIIATKSALDLISGTSLLRAYALKGDISTVQRILSAMEGRSGVKVNGLEVGSWPNTGVYGSIIPDTTCYNVALAAAAKAGGQAGLDIALDLFDTMCDPKEKGVRPQKDVVTFNTVIGALAKAGRQQEVFELFERMMKAGIKPDKYTYTALIKVCKEDGDLQELLIDMKEKGVQADTITYNAMIKLLCDRNKWFIATKLVTDMESRGIAPNSMTYGILMNALLKAGKPSSCLTLFETACSDPRTAPLTENVYLYTTAIKATSEVGNYERALDLISRMKIAGVKANLKTVTALMKSCLTSGKPDIAANFYKKIEEPDSLANNLGLKALCQSGDLATASALLSDLRDGYGSMSGKDVMFSYNTLLCSALEQKDFDMAKKTLTELLGSGYIPSKNLYQSILASLNLGQPPRRRSAISSAFVQIQISDEAFNFLVFLLDSIRQRNLSIDGSFYSSILACGSRLGGLQRKMASLLTEARAITSSSTASGKSIADVGRVNGSASINGNDTKVIGWEELLVNYDSYKTEIGKSVQLPWLSVNINNRNIRKVLSAEQAVTNNSINRVKRSQKNKLTR